MPDIIYDALWNGAANTQDPVGPATDWARHQRIHQYLGGQNVTYGGDTINIDQDYLDVQRPALAGGRAQAPPAAAQPAGAVDAFFRGADGQLWHARYTPGSGWGKPRDLGEQLSSGPAPAVSGRGALTVFRKGQDGHLWVIRRKPGSSWTHPANLGMGRLGGAPAATGLARARSMCAGRPSRTPACGSSASPGHGWVRLMT